MVHSAPGAFGLSGNLKKLKCPCGKSEMTAEFLEDDRILLCIPCASCPRPHRYTVSRGLFLGDQLLRIPCRLSGVTVCFAGPEKQVRQAAEEDDKNWQEELGAHSFEEIRPNGDAKELDPQILDMLIYTVHELNDENAITCHCLPGEGEYAVTVTEEGILVECQNCEAKRLIRAESLAEAEEFLRSDVLHLN